MSAWMARVSLPRITRYICLCEIVRSVSNFSVVLISIKGRFLYLIGPSLNRNDRAQGDHEQGSRVQTFWIFAIAN